MASLFSNQETLYLMRSAEQVLEVSLSSSDLRRDTPEYHLKFFTLMSLREFQARSESYDDACAYNISDFGSKFLTALNEFVGRSKDVEVLFSMAYRFVCEYELSSGNDLSETLVSAKKELVGLDLSSHLVAKWQYEFANTQMLFNVVRQTLKSPEVNSLKEYGLLAKKAEKSFEDFEASFAEKIDRISELEIRLKKGEQDYNFANLNDGFSKLKTAKLDEKKSSIEALWALGVLLVAFPVAKILGWLPEPSTQLSMAVNTAALVGLELLLVYYFRIVYHNFRAAKLQILQIDLRMTLCSFIESYSDFAVDVREKDKEALARFEQIIFSEVAAGDPSIPSAFEGFEHISSIVGKLKAK